MAKVQRIEILSFAKLYALIGASVGLLLGIVYSVGGLVIDTLVTLGWMTSTETPGLSYGTLLAFGALVGMPLICAAVGFIVGFIGALIYNVYAKRFGGIDIEFS